MSVNSKFNKHLVEKVDPLFCLQQIVDSYSRYQEIAQQEQTKRRNIVAWEKTTIEEIHSNREILITYLERSFDERAENFKQLFQCLDQAMNSGNNQQFAIVLESIVDIAKSSPFKDLASLSSVQKALDDPNHCWEF